MTFMLSITLLVATLIAEVLFKGLSIRLLCYRLHIAGIFGALLFREVQIVEGYV